METAARAGQANGAQLSAREIECLRWLGEGKTLADSGVILGLSPRTVKFHLENVRRKLDCSTSVQAVAAAVRKGLI